ELEEVARGEGLAIAAVWGPLDFRLARPPVALAASRDGTRIAAIDGAGFLRFFTAQGELLGVLDLDLEPTATVAFPPDGAHVVVGSGLRMIVIASGGGTATEYHYARRITSIAWSDDDWIGRATEPGTLEFRDPRGQGADLVLQPPESARGP